MTVHAGELLKLLDSISKCQEPSKRDQLFEPLQEIITYVQFANDECDVTMVWVLNWGWTCSVMEIVVFMVWWGICCHWPTNSWVGASMGEL